MKKVFILPFIFMAGFFLSLQGAVSEVQVSIYEVKALENENSEEDNVAFTAKKGEYLKLIAKKENMVRVQNGRGKIGWVKKTDVAPVMRDATGKQTFKMDEAKVLGYLENPQAVYILDMSDPNFKPIKLDRSFGDNIAGNIDKETNQRINDPNLKPEQ